MIDKNSIKEKTWWQSIPKWLIPIVVIVAVGVIFFVGQYFSILVLSLYAAVKGWSVAQANAWLNNSVTAQFLYVLLAEAATVGLVFAAMRSIGKGLGSLGLNRYRAKYVLFAVLAYPAYLIIYLVFLTVAKHLYPALNLNQTQHIGFNSVHGTYQLVLTFFSLVVLPPIAEEVLFRGFLFEGLKKAMPVFWAAILTSVLFASAHLPEGGAAGPLWVGAIDTFTLSLVLVFLKQKTKSLWAGIFLHAIKNGVAFASLFLLSSR